MVLASYGMLRGAEYWACYAVSGTEIVYSASCLRYHMRCAVLRSRVVLPGQRVAEPYAHRTRAAARYVPTRILIPLIAYVGSIALCGARY
eukprot:2242511-Rhodomonas_salina.1